MRVYYLAECGHHRYLGFPCGTCEHNQAIQPVAVPQGYTAQKLLAQKDEQIDQLIGEIKRLRRVLAQIVEYCDEPDCKLFEHQEARKALEGE